MADNEIRQKITLEGIDAIIAQLKQLGQSGEQAFRQLKNTVNEQPFARLSASVNEASARHRVFAGAATEASSAANKFREAIHIAHPIMRAAGIELAGLGSYARLAGGGLIALGTAVAGSVLFSLAKLGDGALIARQRIQELQAGPRGAAGGNAFSLLSKAAQDLKTDVVNLGPALEILLNNATKFSGVRFAPGSAGEVAQTQKFVTVIKTMFAALESGSASSEEAGKALTQFLAKIAEAGRLTPEVFKELTQAAPAATNALIRALGYSGKTAEDFFKELQSGSSVSARALIDAIARSSRTIIENAEHQNEGVRTVGRALDEVSVKWKNAFSDTGARTAVVDLLGLLGRLADKTAEFGQIWRVATAVPTLGRGFENYFNNLKAIFGLGPAPSRAASFEDRFGAAEGSLKPFTQLPTIIGGLSKSLDGLANSAKGAAGSVTNLGNYLINLRDYIAYPAAKTKPAESYTTPYDIQQNTYGGYYGNPNFQYASGGSVIGAGTGTSDSILARLSNGEYVINSTSARAVGTGFLNAINSIGGYASGGSVREALGISDFVRSITPSLPRFAAGGMASSMGHFTVDLRTNAGSFQVQATESVARQLNRYAVDQRLTRTGRMPNWRT